MDGDLTVIADALQASVTIHTLILRGNSFGEPGMEALGSLLVRTPLRRAGCCVARVRVTWVVCW